MVTNKCKSSVWTLSPPAPSLRSLRGSEVTGHHAIRRSELKPNARVHSKAEYLRDFWPMLVMRAALAQLEKALESETTIKRKSGQEKNQERKHSK